MGFCTLWFPPGDSAGEILELFSALVSFRRFVSPFRLHLKMDTAVELRTVQLLMLIVSIFTEEEAGIAFREGMVTREIRRKKFLSLCHLGQLNSIRPQQPQLTYTPSNFSIETRTDIWCIEFLRFNKYQINQLARLLEIPEKYRSRYHAAPTTALAITLYRLSYPSRLKQALEIFGHSKSYLSIIFNDVCIHIYHRYQAKLFWNCSQLTPAALTRYCAAIEAKGCPGGKVWGFIDGTHRTICRPTPTVADQAWFYTGYKKSHTMQFQGVTTPDGMIRSIAGPFEGRNSDWGIWRLSGLQAVLNIHSVNLNGEEVFLYGDGAYRRQRGIMGTYKALPGVPLTHRQKTFNTEMSRLRICVEWSFGKVLQYFGYVGHKMGMKMGLSPVAAYYLTAVFFTNCHTCYYGSNTSFYFDCLPPSIEEYLHE
jgi:hypothetical protein